MKSKPISDFFFWLPQLKQPNNQQKIHSIPSQKPSCAKEWSRGKKWLILSCMEFLGGPCDLKYHLQVYMYIPMIYNGMNA